MVTRKKVAVKSLDAFYDSNEFKRFFKTILQRRGYGLDEIAFILGYNPKYVRSQVYLNTKVSMNLMETIIDYLGINKSTATKLKNLALNKNGSITKRLSVTV